MPTTNPVRTVLLTYQKPAVLAYILHEDDECVYVRPVRWADSDTSIQIPKDASAYVELSPGKSPVTTDLTLQHEGGVRHEHHRIFAGKAWVTDKPDVKFNVEMHRSLYTSVLDGVREHVRYWIDGKPEMISGELDFVETLLAMTFEKEMMG